MNIIVLKNSKFKSNYATCIYTLLGEIAQQKGYQVVAANNFNEALTTTNNSIVFVTLKAATALNKYIRRQRLKLVIKKNNTNLLIQEARAFIKQKRIPQILIADDLETLPPLKKISHDNIFLLTYSQYAKHLLAEKGYTNLIHVVPFFATPVFEPINWSMKQQLKIDYTEGREYFFVMQSFKSMEDILKLLKAFSGFKKWQQSSMKLVIGGKLYVPPSDWKEKFGSYRYREDVLVLDKLGEDQKVRLLAGAYASIYLPKKDNDLLPLVQSIQCHTPVIAFETASIKEYAASAVLTAETNNYEELTQQMILMYKDEILRNKLAENCAVIAEAFSKEKTRQSLETVVL